MVLAARWWWCSPASGAFHPRRIAAGRGEVDVEIGGVGVGEELPDRRFQFTAFSEEPAHYHGVTVEGAHRDRAETQLLRHLVHHIVLLFALPHIYRKAHAIRRVHRMMLVIDEEKLVARLR